MVSGDGGGVASLDDRRIRRGRVRICSDGDPETTRVSVVAEDGQEIELSHVIEVLYRISTKSRGVVLIKTLCADVDLIGTARMEACDAPWYNEDEESGESESGEEV